jgi:hypothetical protein
MTLPFGVIGASGFMPGPGAGLVAQVVCLCTDLRTARRTATATLIRALLPATDRFGLVGREGCLRADVQRAGVHDHRAAGLESESDDEGNESNQGTHGMPPKCDSCSRESAGYSNIHNNTKHP